MEKLTRAVCLLMRLTLPYATGRRRYKNSAALLQLVAKRNAPSAMQQTAITQARAWAGFSRAIPWAKAPAASSISLRQMQKLPSSWCGVVKSLSSTGRRNQSVPAMGGRSGNGGGDRGNQGVGLADEMRTFGRFKQKRA